MKSNKIAVINNLDIVNGSALKRAGALIIDLVITYFVMFLLNFGIHPLLNATYYDYDTNSVIHLRDMKKSYLVTLSEPLTSDFSNIDTVKVTLDSVSEIYRGEATYNFYMIFLNSEIADVNEKMTNEQYLINILDIGSEDSIYVRAVEETNPKKYHLGESEVDSESSEDTSEAPILSDPFVPFGAAFKAGVTDEQINTFNAAIYKGAITIFKARPLAVALTKFVNILNVSLIILASSITILAVPLFMKNGQSLGKMLFKLGISDSYGYKVGSLKLLLRYLAFILINVLSNYLIPIIFPFISLTIMVFNKKGLSGHDFAAGTRVVDLTKSIIYDNVDAYQNAQNVVIDNDHDVNEEVFSERFDEESGA